MRLGGNMRLVRLTLSVLFISMLLLINSCSEKTTESKNEVAAPTFNPSGGVYTAPQEVEILCETEGAIIRYTTDDSDPLENSREYTAAIEVLESTTIKARAYKNNWLESGIASAYYTIESVPDVDSLTFGSLPSEPELDSVVEISARALDSLNNPVPDSSKIYFYTNKGFFVDSEDEDGNYLGYTENGWASVEWNTGTVAGDVTLTAKTTNLEAHLETKILPGDPKFLFATAEYRDRDTWIDLAESYPEGIPVDIDKDLRIRVEVKDIFNNRVQSGIPIKFDADLGEIDSIAMTDAFGIVTAGYYPQNVTGNATIRISTFGEEAYTSIKFIPGSPAQVELFIDDYNSGTSLGDGMWRVEVGAIVTDIYGNKVIDGTVVHFSLAEQPIPPPETSIKGAVYIGNPGDHHEEGVEGIAFTHLNYHGKNTNLPIAIKAESGGQEGSITQQLPLQQPHLTLSASPEQIDFYADDPDDHAKNIEIFAILKDGQDNLIVGSKIVLSGANFTYHKELPEVYKGSTPNIIITLPGSDGLPPFGERGRAYGMLRVSIWELPPPVDECCTEVDVQIIGKLQDTSVQSHANITARRINKPRP